MPLKYVICQKEIYSGLHVIVYVSFAAVCLRTAMKEYCIVVSWFHG